jgi:hypothetical protein
MAKMDVVVMGAGSSGAAVAQRHPDHALRAPLGAATPALSDRCLPRLLADSHVTSRNVPVTGTLGLVAE